MPQARVIVLKTILAELPDIVITRPMIILLIVLHPVKTVIKIQVQPAMILAVMLAVK